MMTMAAIVAPSSIQVASESGRLGQVFVCLLWIVIIDAECTYQIGYWFSFPNAIRFRRRP